MTAHKVILYDDNCPLCCWYTGAFVKTGLLPQDGRQAFAEIQPEDMNSRLDIERSKDEIPLLDTNGGGTLYGIDSLLYILGQRWPWMENLGNWGPLNWFLRRLYNFISYNRRVIVAGETPVGSFDCSPQFNYFYRHLYIAFASLLGATTIVAALWAYGLGFMAFVAPLITLLLLLLPMGSLPNKRTRLNYLGIMLTPYLAMGLILGLSALLQLPLWLGLILATSLAIQMWWRRWAVARKVVLEL